MADYHVRRSRMSSSGSDDFEDESLDPRIQVELEKLNKASEEINRLELELDDARASFRQTLSESTQKLDVLAKKLGSCVEKARPYYDARVKAKEAHLETQRAALRFERACSMHEAAKEMVQLAEQGYMRREQPSDPAWQEMLNHATMKVNEAEKERNESEQEHQRTMIRFKVAEDQVQGLQKELKRTIAKSKPYFEMKAKFNQIMEEHKHKVSMLEEDVSSAKSLYSTALRSLEAISDEIHHQRLQRRQHQQLGVRGAGVGAECPLPPPSWEKGSSVEGQDSGNYQTMDPLGVVKISTVSFATNGSRRRSRNLSGESSHGKDVVEETAARDDPTVCSQDTEPTHQGHTDTGSGEKEGETSDRVASPVSDSPSPKEKILIPGDPLGVVPPTYTSTRRSRPSKVHPSSPSGGISHPAFSGSGSPHSAAHSSYVAHPMVSQSCPSPMMAGVRSKSTSAGPVQFVPPSVLHPNPEHARRQSYRQAVEASEEDAEQEDKGELYLAGEEGGSRDVFNAVSESRQRSHSSPVDPSDDPRTRSPPHAIPRKPSTGGHDALADGRTYGSAPERSVTLTSPQDVSRSQEGSPADMSPTLARRKQKLQGLILRIDPTMDPLRNFEPGARSQPSPSARGTPPCSRSNPPSTSPPSALAEKENLTPTPTQTGSGMAKPQLLAEACEVRSDLPVSKPIIRSASSVSTAGSERSDADFSEVESVSATQSPTKPRSRLLNVPSSMDTVEDSSDTESLASTGPMLDDEQVEFLTMDFSNINLERDREDYSSSTLPSHLKRNSWSRMSLPPRLSYLEGLLSHQKCTTGELESPGNDCLESPREDHGEFVSEEPSDTTDGGAAPVTAISLTDSGAEGDRHTVCVEEVSEA